MEGLTADPAMVQTSWRPGQLAGWFIITKERHHHMLITSKMKSAGKLIATA
jgi:hypothetical protein